MIVIYSIYIIISFFYKYTILDPPCPYGQGGMNRETNKKKKKKKGGEKINNINSF